MDSWASLSNADPKQWVIWARNQKHGNLDSCSAWDVCSPFSLNFGNLGDLESWGVIFLKGGMQNSSWKKPGSPPNPHPKIQVKSLSQTSNEQPVGATPGQCATGGAEPGASQPKPYKNHRKTIGKPLKSPVYHHFPVVFLWLSTGFPMISHGFPMVGLTYLVEQKLKAMPSRYLYLSIRWLGHLESSSVAGSPTEQWNIMNVMEYKYPKHTMNRSLLATGLLYGYPVVI